MPLKAIHDSIDEIPEQYRDLYTEKNGKWELTGIQGVKTQADVDRLQTSLTKERDEHKATKDKLAVWDGMDHAETVANLDRIPALEAASSGKMDDAAIEAEVSRRVEGTIKSQIAPLERQIGTLTKDNEALTASNTELTTSINNGKIDNVVRAAMAKSNAHGTAVDDALMLAKSGVFSIAEDGAILTAENNMGIPSGLDPDAFVGHMQGVRRHWWPESSGSGAPGSGGSGGPTGDNPFSHANWNMTKQGALVRSDRAMAERLAKQAGTTIGGQRPSAPAK